MYTCMYIHQVVAHWLSSFSLRYFSLVVALHADTADGSYPVVAHVSERIIVRASNPGNFDNDCDSTWLKAANPDCIFHHVSADTSPREAQLRN